MEKTGRACPGIDCPSLNAGPQSIEHERRFSGLIGTGLVANNSTEKTGEGAIKQNPAK